MVKCSNYQIHFQEAENFRQRNEIGLESVNMWNAIVPKGSYFSRGQRGSWLAAACLVALLSLGFGSGNAFGQDPQDAPPPPPQAGQQPDQQSGPGMGRGMGRRPMESVDDQIQHLSKKLKLSDDQQAKLKPILEDQNKQMEQIHNDTSLSREDRFGKMQALRQSSDTQIKSVLNEEQQKGFDKMREEQRDRMKQWRKGGDTPPPPPSNPDNQQ
jgi:protein CpxP